MGMRVKVNPANPGQFFACCGLLDLADRASGGAEGWFEDREFCIAGDLDLPALVDLLTGAELRQIDGEDTTSSPISIGAPFGDLRLDWWKDEQAGGKELKVWAGTMESTRIARAMQNAMRDPKFRECDLLDVGVVAFDPDDAGKKVEPFYFDARRARNAHSRDVGFAPNDLQMTTTAFPAVELLCLIGLQRCLPERGGRPRVFEYFTWATPTLPSLLPAAVIGLLSPADQVGYRFENWYRTGQKKHKAFRFATVFTAANRKEPRP
jgi:hypothetical protein